MFTLVVDDFGIKCINREVAEHLIATLKELYTVTVNWKEDKYLGFNIDWDYLAGTVTLSMRDYVGKLLERFAHGTEVRGARSPARYTTPTYGSTSPQMTHVDDSPALGKDDSLFLQEMVGCFIYYAKAVDYTNQSQKPPRWTRHATC